MRAGEALFARRSVDAVTIDDVVAEAAVAKGSFYNHFPDKESLAQTIAEAVRIEIEKRVTAGNEGISDPAARLARGIAVYLRFARDEPRRARILLRLFPNETSAAAPINRGLARDIQAGVAQKRFDVASIQAAVVCVVGVGTAAQARILDDPRPPETLRLSQQVLVQTLRGLGMRVREAGRISRATLDDIFAQQSPLPDPRTPAPGLQPRPSRRRPSKPRR